MRIAVLGPLEVTADDGRPILVPGAKERLLLGVLVAAAPSVVSTDRLVDALWSGDRPVDARKALQGHLVHLRSALEPDRPRGSSGRFLLRRGAGYALVTAPEDLDARVIGDLLARGRTLLAAGDPAGAAQLLSGALALWRGEPYADWPDAPFTHAERCRLAEVRVATLTAWLEARLALGRHTDVLADLERLLADDPLQEEWWRLLVLALYRSGRQGDALAAVTRARAVLADQLGADPGPRLRAAEAAVLAQDPELDAPPPSRSVPEVAVCPYKGLAPYSAADAGLFSGRRRAVGSLVAGLVDAPLVLVTGPSGVGKTSVVRAGLVPALAAGALPGSAGWRPVVLTPGRHPDLGRTALTAGLREPGPVLLVLDQFDDVWAPGADEAARDALLEEVVRLIDEGRVPRCVAVVRDPGPDRLAAFPERLGTAVVPIRPLSEDEIREVVRGPASAVGLVPEDDLLAAVVADVAGRPGALPLLSKAMVGTWEHRRGHRLTLAGYLEAGGVPGALVHLADDAYAALGDAGRRDARRLLLRLADTDDRGAVVPRPLPRAEWADDGTAPPEVAEVLVARRLLTVDGRALEVAHEALLSAWPRLAGWLEEDAVGRAVRRRLTPAAQEWQRLGGAEDELLRGPRLSAALEWAAGAGGDLLPLERRFLDASKARADAELREARDRAHRVAVAQARTRRMAVGLAVVLLVAAVVTVLSRRDAQRAERAALVADANRLAALSATVGALDLRYLLAAQGFRLGDTPETRDALLAALVEHPRVTRALAVPLPGSRPEGQLADGGRTAFLGTGPGLLRWEVGSSAPPRPVPGLAEQDRAGWRVVAASPADASLLVAGTSGSGGSWVRVVDADGAVRTVPSGADPGGRPIGAAVLADGRRARLLVAAAGDPTTSTWRLVEVDLRDGVRSDTGVRGTIPGAPGELSASVSDDGASAVVSRGGRAAVLVDLGTGRQVALPAPGGDPGTRVVHRVLPSGAAALRSDGAVVLLDRSGQVRQQLDVGAGAVLDIEVAPDGTWGVTSGEDGTVVVWDVDPATGHWSERERPAGATGPVGAAVIDPTGSRLVTVSGDGSVIAWDVSPAGRAGAPRRGTGGSPTTPSAWLRDVCSVVGRDLTRAEWTRYLPGREHRATCTDLA